MWTKDRKQGSGNKFFEAMESVHARSENRATEEIAGEHFYGMRGFIKTSKIQESTTAFVTLIMGRVSGVELIEES